MPCSDNATRKHTKYIIQVGGMSLKSTKKKIMRYCRCSD